MKLSRKSLKSGAERVPVESSSVLNEKQARFAEEYAVDLNATQAAIRAGYSPETARQQGSRLLTNAYIRARVEELRKELAEASRIDALWIRERLRENVDRAMQLEEVQREGKPTGEYVYQGNVANKALELLGKDRGMFVEKHEVTGKDGGPIETRQSIDASKLSTETLRRIQKEAGE